MRKILFFLFSYLIVGSTALAEIEYQEWSDLIDQSSQEYDDPFKSLSADQLGSLIETVRLKSNLESNSLSDKTRQGLEARLTSAEGLLIDAGIDIDWLLSQRWIVAENRKKAATAGNPRIDGQVIRLSGYALAAPDDPDGTKTIYLVPERGMCSHTPPPNPNQLVRVRLTGDWLPERLHEPVRLTGKISISPSERTMHLVDGFVPMRATFELEASNVETEDELLKAGLILPIDAVRKRASKIGYSGSGAPRYSASRASEVHYDGTK
ncbi:DUF3299 domain-containing protein [Ruegeria sp. AU67]|uniref:DUF3299 domain-containing protein n=1 Tax=Ruegeria sp. AU67 TaxID=2108530 RepID=UPI000D689BD7|nr:DUF3299 domain-containing protein [Ruegeria sp. AU67]